MTDVIRCETAILVDGKSRVSIDPSMEALEQYFKDIPEIAPWMTPKNGPNKGPGPYRLYLISIMPSIVVAVPEKRTTAWSCWDSPLRKGCMPSRTLDLNSYWFRADPKLAEGSFWFSPQKPGGAVPIDASRPVLRIKVDRADITLASVNGFWVQRTMP